MALRDYTDSPLFRQFIDRLMRENGLNPNQAASYLNMVLNASARNEDREGTFRMGASDFSRLKRGLSQSGRGLDADFLRRTRSAKELGELTEDEQIMLNLLNAANSPRFLGTMREGVNAVAGGERDAIQKAAMNYIQTFTLGNGDPRGGVGRIQRAMDAGSTVYGNDPLAYYNDTLLPRFNQITSDILKEGKFLASTEVTPQITRRKESVRNYDYGDLTKIAQDFGPNEFVEYDPQRREAWVNVITDPRTNDLSYRYWIPSNIDYAYRIDSPMYADLSAEEADVLIEVAARRDREFLKGINGVSFYTETEPFSSESALLNDSLEFVPEKVQELQREGTVIPFSFLRFNREAYNNLINTFRAGNEQVGILPDVDANLLREKMRTHGSETFMEHLGTAQGNIARLRIQGLREGWLRRKESRAPGWKGYRTYSGESDDATLEELEEERRWGPDKNAVNNPESPFKNYSPYEPFDYEQELLPDYGPEEPYPDREGWLLPEERQPIPMKHQFRPRKQRKQTKSAITQQTVPQKDLFRASRDAQRTIENTPYGAPFERLGARQNNPFNIRHFKSQGPWIGEEEFENTPEGGYKTFATREIGLSQGIRQVVINDILRRGLNTTSTLFKKFAPKDNVGTDPVLYTNNMAQNMGINPNDILDPLNEDQMAKLIMGILIQETQNEPRYTDEEIRNAYRQVIQTAREREDIYNDHSRT